MKIIVCIKQVPGTTAVEIDPETGNLIRDAGNTKMNPYDLYAIETALRFKEEKGATITAVSMGPPQAADVLREALWMGCDDAVLLSDRKFAGADVVATSYTLSSGIKNIGDFHLIICGKQTTDGDTAQVGPETAEHLGIPHISYVDKIIRIKEKSVVVSVSMDKTTEEWEIDYPCLITVDKGIFTPRLPSYKRGRLFKNHSIKVLGFQDMLDQDENNYGLQGSPTRVERMFPPERMTDKELWKDTSDNLALKMYNKMKELKVI